MLNVKVQECDVDRYVTVVGDVDLEVINDFRDTMLAIAEGATGMVTIDVSRLRYTYSDGLGVLLELRNRLAETGATLRLLNPTSGIREMITTAALDKLVPMVSD